MQPKSRIQTQPTTTARPPNLVTKLNTDALDIATLAASSFPLSPRWADSGRSRTTGCNVTSHIGTHAYPFPSLPRPPPASDHLTLPHLTLPLTVHFLTFPSNCLHCIALHRLASPCLCVYLCVVHLAVQHDVVSSFLSMAYPVHLTFASGRRDWRSYPSDSCLIRPRCPKTL